jgi:hypothetical protein
MEREIVVRGTGEARALPDLAGLGVEVTIDHKTQEEAHDARTKLATAVDVGAAVLGAQWSMAPTNPEVGFTILDLPRTADAD